MSLTFGSGTFGFPGATFDGSLGVTLVTPTTVAATATVQTPPVLATDINLTRSTIVALTTVPMPTVTGEIGGNFDGVALVVRDNAYVPTISKDSSYVSTYSKVGTP